MEANTPEPISRPVDTNEKPAMNVPPTTLPTHTAGSGSTPLGAPASNVGKPKKGKKILLVLLFVVLAGAAAGLGYMYWKQKQTISTDKAALQSDLDSAKKDLASAQKKVKELEASTSPSPSPTTTPKTDAEAITAAAKAFAPSAVAYKADAAVYGAPKISAKDKNFASVGISTKGETGGYSLILKKTNGVWVVVVAGLQNTPSTTDISIYGIPTDMP